MWLLVKYEFKYNWYTYLLLALLLLAYTFFVLVDIQLLEGKRFEIDYWGGLYSFFLVVFTLSVWGTRFKENRNRFFQILPVSVNDLAISRFFFSSIPFTIFVLYLIIVHLIIMSSWHAESSSMLAQIGLIFVLFTGFIRGRDDWFSHWSFGKRFQNAFIATLIIQIFVVAIFVALPNMYEEFTPLFGDMFYHYIKVIFYLLGLVISITTIFSFLKRKSYLG